MMQDLEQLKAVYREIIRDMEARGIDIWDDIYPCEFFADDIKKKRLYVLSGGEEILSAFALEENKIHCVNDEIEDSFRNKRLSKRPIFTRFCANGKRPAFIGAESERDETAVK